MERYFIEEIIAEIFNKLQAPKTALELYVKGRVVSKKFTKTALKELAKTVELLKLLREKGLN